MKSHFLLLFTVLSVSILYSQTAPKYQLNGYITDKANGEAMIEATVYIKETKSGANSNSYGYYSITLPADTYTVLIQYIGYKTEERQILLYSDTKLNIELGEEETVLEEITISAEKGANIDRVEMSTTTLSISEIKKIPALFGEIDIIKTIQMLPGVVAAGEGFGTYYVRGGGSDQNLIVLDEATVYNVSHLLGFFSVFNSDAIKDVKLYKGGIPAEYGSRLSSLLDVRMKEGNNKQWEVTGGIGTISSRLTIEGPIKKERASFMVSARRTYADIFLKLSPEEEVRSNKLYFYDLNAKLNFKIGEKDKIYISGYFGQDKFLNNAEGAEFGTDWGNYTATARWNHVSKEKFFNNMTLIYSRYDYSLYVPQGNLAFDWDSYIQDFSLKEDFTAFINSRHELKAGGAITHHTFSPGEFVPSNDESFFDAFIIPNKHGIESALYISHEYKYKFFTLQAGLRYSLFNLIGKGRIFTYNNEGDAIDTNSYGNFEGISFYQGLEPRLGMNFKLSDDDAIKLSYNRTFQYLHLISGSSISTPYDIWIPVDPYIKPQFADQVAVGYFRNFFDDKIEASVELYYKHLHNQLDYKDNADLILNEALQPELLRGKGWSYGAEFFLRKTSGRVTGWISYTLSKTRRQVEGINNGDPYPVPYDRTHNLSIVSTFQINERWNIGGTFVYYTGLAATFPAARFSYQGVQAPIFTERNGFRLPGYHRMDFSVTYAFKKKKRWGSELNLSIYNLYYRKNAFSIVFREDDETGTTAAYKTYLFPIVPALTYNFKF